MPAALRRMTIAMAAQFRTPPLASVAANKSTRSRVALCASQLVELTDCVTSQAHAQQNHDPEPEGSAIGSRKPSA